MLIQRTEPDLLSRVFDLVEPESAEQLVRNHLERPDMPVVAVKPVGVRPKSTAGGLVTYSVDLADGTTTYASARVASPERLRVGWERLESERAKWRGGLAAAALVEEPGVLLTSFPLDRRLRWLRPFTEAEKAKSLLFNSGVVDGTVRVSKRRSSVELASYRAERRAVLKWSFACKSPGRSRRNEGLFVRLHADPTRAERSSLALRAAKARGVPVPAPLVVDTERGIAVERAVGGSFVRSGVVGEADARLVGELAAQLHRVPAPRALAARRRDSRLRQATKAVRGLLVIAPELGEAARRQLIALGERAGPARPDTLRLLHGDLHGGQLVIGSEGAFLVDFDRARGGHPAQDIASFWAQSLLERPATAAAEFASFAAGYRSHAGWFDEDVLGHHTAVELLCLADAPFRRVMPDWRAATTRLVGHIDRLLPRGGWA